MHDGHITPTDLAAFLACRHKTTLDHEVARGLRRKPRYLPDDALAQAGLAHEQAYVATLSDVVDLTDHPDRLTATLDAMRAGKGAIVQGTLQRDGWHGRPDVLERQPDGTYEVVDTKLARETKGGTILQLAVYSDLLPQRPQRFHVVTPAGKETYRLDDYTAYVRLVRAQMQHHLATPAATYPEPCDHCGVCRWWQECDARRREDDHLSLVAGLSRIQRRDLAPHGITTLTQLATQPPPTDAFAKVQRQAHLQLAARTAPAQVELLPVEPGRGFTRLPAPSTGDVFLDLEGDPYARDGGREYLFGVTSAEGHHAMWAFDDAQERAAFEAVVDDIMRRWAADPSMHVFHYNHYEPTAFKKLMGRHATREAEIDRMLRAGLFVDLYGVVKGALQAGVEGYGLKQLEPLTGFTRAVALADARPNLRAMERALQLRVPLADVPADVRAAVEGYNRDDCASTMVLRDRLEAERARLVEAGTECPRPAPQDGAPSEELDERAQRVAAMKARLLHDVPADPAERSEQQQAKRLLAHLLDWHRREMKSEYWEKFRLADLDEDELLEERAGVAALRFVARVRHPAGRVKRVVDRYAYAPQEVDLKDDVDAYLPGGEKLGEVVACDRGARTFDVEKKVDQTDVHPTAVYLHKLFDNKDAPAALMRIAEDVATNGLGVDGDHAVARQLLLGRPPRLRAGPFVQVGDQTATDFAVHAAAELDRSVLAVQGPPGSGKTYTGAHMIVELVRRGLKVGVTAQSHKVIRKLLEDAIKVAASSGTTIACAHKVKEAGALGPTLVNEIVDSKERGQCLHDGRAQVFGATVFVWPHVDAHAAVDVLIVDEAGQMSLANVLAASQAAGSVVLLGDPQQLEQPTKGAHPDGAERSALQHLLATGPRPSSPSHEAPRTIAADRGVFLHETRRLAPAICAFTSEAFYEGRLHALAGLDRQTLAGTRAFDGAGLWFVPVDHAGNRNTSPEEIDTVSAIVDALLADGATWTDAHGAARPTTPADVLVVAPYNTHVAMLQDRLAARGVAVGTVDRFQGQEAPVVIYSTATSSPEDAPRGMEFLYSLNRLNVATSRARCACILVASPRLLEPECKTPRQMQLANGLCRYRELAKIVLPSALSRPPTSSLRRIDTLTG